MSMKRTYLYKLAFRNIITHKLRSVLTIAGVAIGVGFVVFLISLGYGLQRISTEQIGNLDALQIIDATPGKSKIVKVDDEALEKFRGLSDVTTVSPELSLVGKISYGTSTTEGVVYGKNTDYLKLEDPRIVEGKLYTDNLSDQAVVNQTTVKQLGMGSAKDAVGKKLSLRVMIAKDRLGKEESSKMEDLTVEVVGVLENESSPYVYIPLGKYIAAGVTSYSSAKVKVANKESVDGTKRQLENLGYKTTTLKDTVDQINQFFTIFQLILLSFGIIAVVVAALGMFNTLTISLLEKTREISFMKVLGTEQKDIWRLFLDESIIIGILGTGLGIIGGSLIGAGLNNFLIDLAQKTGNKPVEIFYTPWAFIVIIFVVAFVISVLTGIYPSYRAARIDPLEAMRYE